MRYIILGLLVAILPAFQCEKDLIDNCITDLTITETAPPASGTVGNDLRIPLTCSGADLCYSFSSLEITNPEPRRYHVRTKGIRPCGPAICAQAIFYADTAVHITPPVAGQYIFQYFTADTEVAADTVTVN
jgi:hypothetical protein